MILRYLLFDIDIEITVFHFQPTVYYIIRRRIIAAADMTQQRQHFKYKIMAHIVKLHLNKNLNFETKITWKRNVNKSETESVLHQNCQSVFDQQLQLELNLIYNSTESKFQPKLTYFSVVVLYQGKIKSGGQVRYDAAEVVNSNYNNEVVRLNLLQCPDPEAYIQIVFNYEILEQSSRSLFNELSMLNASGFQNDLSQIDFKEDEKERESQSSSKRESVKLDKENIQELPLKERELSKINNILDKFQSFSRRIVSNQKSLFLEDHNTTKNESLDISSIPTEQEQRLKTRVSQLQSQIQIKSALIQEYQNRLQQTNRKMEEISLKLQLAQQKIKQLEISRQSNKIDLALIESQQKYKQLYQKTLQELEDLKNNISLDPNFSKDNGKFKKLIEELHTINEIPEFQVDKNQQPNSFNQKLDELQRENIELQTKIASVTHNIAQLFNAAYEYGGAELMDHLQNSIGLIEVGL